MKTHMQKIFHMRNLCLHALGTNLDPWYGSIQQNVRRNGVYYGIKLYALKGTDL